MKAVLTNENQFSKYVDDENKQRCLKTLKEQFNEFGECFEFQTDAGEGYSKDRVFCFEFLWTYKNEIVFEFIGSTK